MEEAAAGVEWGGGRVGGHGEVITRSSEIVGRSCGGRAGDRGEVVTPGDVMGTHGGERMGDRARACLQPAQ